ncbi:hypothetical protein CPC16_004648 [Podila verticillata]|nr:hypothetical protein CPC16_004648 [Podila verticillata]
MDDPDDDLYEYGDDDDPVDDLLDELLLSTTCRYLDRPLWYHHSNFDIIHKINNFTPEQCRSVLHMNWTSFMKLTSLLFNHEIFQSTGPRPQEEVAAQLAVTLDRLGHKGNGMAPVRFGDYWGQSPNACKDYYTRGIKAILSLKYRYAKWPDAEE